MSGVRFSSQQQREHAATLRTIFDNDFYRAQRAEGEEQEAFEVFVQNAPVGLLARRARTLHEEIHSATKGVYCFTPGPAIRQEGMHTVIDRTGKRGMPLSWYPLGVPGLHDLLVKSSQLEMELWRRISIREGVLMDPLRVFDTSYTPEIIMQTFSRYYRDTLNTHNGKPMHVESGFYHLPGCSEKFKVKGFPYPHRVSTWTC